MIRMNASSTSARQSILDRIRSRPVDGPPLPEIDSTRVAQYADPIAQFIETLEFVGGKAHLVSSHSEIASVLSEIPVYRDAARVVSLVPDAVASTVDATTIDDPHAFSSVDWTIAPGEFMVAENGAIWIDGNRLPHRVLLFIAQYLAIVVRRSEIVSNMHEAYERIADFDGRFGIFVSGPSKTADIEQSLVLGAHGCRTLQVFVLDG